MLHFIGQSTASVPDEVLLSSDEVTIGRDAKCTLVLDSLTSPRMISRLHAKLTKTQPASEQLMRGVSRAATRSASRIQSIAAPTASYARWLLTDNNSVNGCFVNHIKVTSTLLSDGDIITIGGLGQKIAVGTLFPQPNAEFVFQFRQPELRASVAARAQHADTQDATLPLPPVSHASTARTLVLPDEEEDAISVASHSVAPSEADQDDRKEPAHVAAGGDDEDEEGPTQLLPPHSVGASAAVTQLLPPDASEAPTQLLPPEPAARRPSLRKTNSSDMVDAYVPTQTVLVAGMPASAAAAVHRSFSNAPTQLQPPVSETAATLVIDPAEEEHHAQIQIRINAVPGAAAAAPLGGVDLHAYRVAASIGASMVDEHASATLLISQAGDDAVHAHAGVGVRAMSIDSEAHEDGDAPTQVLPSDSSQVATQIVPASGADIPPPAATISASLLGCMDGLGVATQTQVLPHAELPEVAAAASTPVAARKAASRSDLYDVEEDEIDLHPAVAASSAAAAAHSSAAVSSPAAAAASSPAAATHASSSKKRGRDHAAVEPEDDEVELLPSEDEDAAAARSKRRKVQRKASAAGKRSAAVAPAAAARSLSADCCPVCSARFAAAELEAHVEACLVAAAADEADAAARRLAAELDAADEAALKKPSPKRRPARRAPRAMIGRWDGRWRSRAEEDEEDEADEEEDEDFERDMEEDYYEHGGGYGSASAGRAVAVTAAAAAARPAPARAPAPAPRAPAPAGPKSACPLCDKLFPTADLASHADECEGPDEPCPLCERGFLPSQLREHASKCKGPPILCAICMQPFERDVVEAHQSRCVGVDGRECGVCRELVAGCEFDAHHKRCLQREVDMSQDEKLAIGFQRSEQQRELVNDMQTRAIKWVEEQARRLSEAAYKPLLQRYERLGFSELDLKRTLRYVRNDAPLIIHVNLTNCMKFFVADTHYRNQFETGTSKGTLSSSARTQWENGLFNKIYGKATGYERVKYGVLNIVCDPNGVLACRGYGDSYLLLKSDTMRLRTSFASRDTGGGTAQLATCEHYAHVLLEYSDPELEDVIAVASKRKRCVSSARISSYKEVQYHGPVQFSRDVEAIVVHGRHASDKAMMKLVQQFCEKNKCNMILQEADGV